LVENPSYTSPIGTRMHFLSFFFKLLYNLILENQIRLKFFFTELLKFVFILKIVL